MPKLVITPHHLAWLAAVSLMGWLGWSNSSLTSQLSELMLQQQNLEQRLLVSQGLTQQALARTSPLICPAVQAQTKSDDAQIRPKSANPLAAQTTESSVATDSTSPIQIPPGTDLREALQIIKREQAKNQAAVGANPFDASK